MKLNIISKKNTSIFFAVLMVTSTFAGFVMPVMATDEELQSMNVTPDTRAFNETIQI